MSPSCFICGTRITKKTKILTGDIQKLLQLFCKLESLTDIDSDEWKYFNELHQSNCCSKCYNVLENIERVNNILIETERELKTYLTQVEKLIVRSEEHQNIHNAAWKNSNCSKIRNCILKKVACNNDEISQTNVKEELEIISVSEDPLGDQFNPVIVTTGSLFEGKLCGVDHSSPLLIPNDDDNFEVSHHDDFHYENESDNEGVQAKDKVDSVLKTWEGVKNSYSTNFRKHSSRFRLKRKIIVISEEDDIPEKVAKRETSYRTAKLIAEKALQQYTTPKEDEDLPNIKNSRVSESEAISVEDNEPEPELKPRSKKRAKEKPRGRGGRLLFQPMVIAKENLYLVRWSTYVQNTYTHLHCKAYKCNYQVEFDYYSSFQKMKDHILDEHRGRKHLSTPHPCLLCNTLCKNQEEFRKHIKMHEKIKNPAAARAVCECCLMDTKSCHVRVHAFKHKNEEEKAAARAANDGSANCFRLKESEMTERKYCCDFENCKKSFKKGRNLKRHKQTHLSIEQRTDFTLCPECGVQISKESLSTHMKRIHHPESVDRVLICPICDKRYLPGDRAMLLKHIQVHKGEKPTHLCPECGVSCSDLNYHMKHYHKEAPDPISCQWCDAVYTHKKSLHYHLKRSHPDKYTPRPSYKSLSKFYSGNEPDQKSGFIGPIQRFPCSICEIVCKYRFTLKKHMARKHGEKFITRKRRKPHSIKEVRQPEEEDSNESSNDDEEMDTSESVVPTTTANRRRENFQAPSGIFSIPNPNLQNFEN